VGATAGIWTINPNNDNWLTLMMQPNSLAPRVDGIEIHDYLYFPDGSGDPIPNNGFTDAQSYDIDNRANEGQMAPRIRDIRTILDRVDPEGRIKIIEDEWGDWLVGFNENQDTWLQQGTLMDAISAGETLHVFMENADRLLAAALAQPINVIHSLFLTRPGDGVLVKTPTFYVFEMFKAHHTGNARWAPQSLASQNIQGNGQNFPVLSTGATVDETGAINVSLVNVDLVNQRSLSVSLGSSAAGYAVAGARVITGPAKDSFNPFAEPEQVNSQPLDAASYQHCGKSLHVDLPPKSVVMLRLDPLP
jgi:alpha-N-arabinofuranosidase